MKKYLLDSNGNPINEQKKQKDFNTKTIDHRKKKAQQKLFQNLTAIFTLATFIMTVLSGFRSIMTYTYYGVSLTFFSYDVSKTFVVALKYALIWFGLIGIPYTFYVTKETEKVKRNSRWLLSGVTSFFVVLFSAKDMVGVLRINDLPWWSLIIAYIGLNGLCKYIHPHPIKQYKRFRTTHSAFKKARQFLEGLFFMCPSSWQPQQRFFCSIQGIKQIMSLLV